MRVTIIRVHHHADSRYTSRTRDAKGPQQYMKSEQPNLVFFIQGGSNAPMSFQKERYSVAANVEKNREERK